MVYLKSDLVKMLWEADLFLESDQEGFIAAVQRYNSKDGECGIVFQNGVAYAILDEDKLADPQELLETVAELYKDGESAAEYFPDQYIEIASAGEVAEGVCRYWGINEQDMQDILARLSDLASFWEHWAMDAYGNPIEE